ncbi:hypothetical protein SK069_18045 [Patulibacter brassicae]|uniref:DUF2029 domain-containing protein n=1 Tax=Patulibacter brassicae TaxID=1705717 RepID=A0ABU4VNS8_9ACTN|nr:hypothetical protein [Patulibacter brassicae]MDX8153506.1 hypothetical protein [Patulibacter brassicae]
MSAVFSFSRARRASLLAAWNLRGGVHLSAFVGAFVGAAAVVLYGLRSYAFNDYEFETLAAAQRLLAGDLSGFLERLSAYGGATLLQAPAMLAGAALGGEGTYAAHQDLSAYRASAAPGLVLSAVLAMVLVRRLRLGEGALAAGWAFVTAALVVGSPVAVLAAEAGHPEEALVVALALAAVLLAAADRPLLAAALVGLAAAAKPWALIAVPVVLCATADRRTLLRQLVVCAVAGGALLAPILAAQHGHRDVAAPLQSTTAGIFKPDNLFWFAGERNPRWSATPQARQGGVQVHDARPEDKIFAQRLEPSWVGRVSHPAIVLAAVVLALIYLRRRPPADRGDDLLLLLAAVCWWRCLLDSWNASYYAFGAVGALVAWQAWRGRPPILGLVLALAVWVMFRVLPGDVFTPDRHTAVYLAWAVPAGILMVARLLAPERVGGLAGRVGRPLVGRLPTLARIAGAPAR